MVLDVIECLRVRLLSNRVEGSREFGWKTKLCVSRADQSVFCVVKSHGGVSARLPGTGLDSGCRETARKERDRHTYQKRHVPGNKYLPMGNRIPEKTLVKVPKCLKNGQTVLRKFSKNGD